MRIPDRLTSLADEGIIQEVVRPLMSGKEAQVYLVLSGGEERVAKVYKESQDRSFKQRSEYTEGRKVRNSRDQRAMGKHSRHGREQDEAAWRSAEVDMIYRLRAAGVRVPVPYHFVDGVLIMELVKDAEGQPAPRLGDLHLEADAARQIYDHLLREVVRMLCAGVVHGDLSDFNVLVGPDGPVIIDFPQAVNASSNQNARKLLLRDVDNLHRFYAPFAPSSRGRQPPPYAQEMWQLYQCGELTPDTKLSGRYRASDKQANTDDLLALVADAERDERKRREKLGLSMRGTSNQPALPPSAATRNGPGRQNVQRAQQAGPNRQNVQRAEQSGPNRQNVQRAEQSGPNRQDPQRAQRKGPDRQREQPRPPRPNPHRGTAQTAAHADPKASDTRSTPVSYRWRSAPAPVAVEHTRKREAAPRDTATRDDDARRDASSSLPRNLPRATTRFRTP